MSSARTTIHQVGRSRVPVVEIDRFAADPAALVREAATLSFGPSGRHYPGLRARAASATVQALLAPLSGLLADVYGLSGRVQVIACDWSLVTTPPQALTLVQRLPHVDVPDPARVAVLLYLSGPDLGGTGLFRHRDTGLERLGPDDFGPYQASLEAGLARTGPPPPAYITGSTELFDLIHTIEAAPGRLAIYPSNALHSGLVGSGLPLSSDPAWGRLTLNAFLGPA